MKDKQLIIAASIIGLSILVLAGTLGRVANEIAQARQESAGMVERLEKLSSEVPQLAEEAGDQAGRSAVQGALDEAVLKPLRALAGNPEPSSPSPTAPAIAEPANASDPTSEGAMPSLPSLAGKFPMESAIHVEFVKPRVTIEITTDVEPSTILPGLSKDPAPTEDATTSASLVEMPK